MSTGSRSAHLPRSLDAARRDAARRRIGRATRWIAGGTLAATVAVIGLAARDDPGHHAGAATSTQNAGAGQPASGGSAPQSSVGPSPTDGATGGGGLSSPPVAPSPSDRSPHAVTGQS